MFSSMIICCSCNKALTLSHKKNATSLFTRSSKGLFVAHILVFACSVHSHSVVLPTKNIHRNVLTLRFEPVKVFLSVLEILFLHTWSHRLWGDWSLSGDFSLLARKIAPLEVPISDTRCLFCFARWWWLFCEQLFGKWHVCSSNKRFISWFVHISLFQFLISHVWPVFDPSLNFCVDFVYETHEVFLDFPFVCTLEHSCVVFSINQSINFI